MIINGNGAGGWKWRWNYVGHERGHEAARAKKKISIIAEIIHCTHDWIDFNLICRPARDFTTMCVLENLTSASWEYIRSFKIREQAELDFFTEARPGAPRQASRKHGRRPRGRRRRASARRLTGEVISPLCGRAPLVSQSARGTCAALARAAAQWSCSEKVSEHTRSPRHEGDGPP